MISLMAKTSSNPEPLRLRIEPIITNAVALQQTVARDLSGHEGLAQAAQGLADAARQAERVSRDLQRPLSLHRLPAVFLLLALLILIGWIYVRFFRVTTLTIALPDRDAQELRLRVTRGESVSSRGLFLVREKVRSWCKQGKPIWLLCRGESGLTANFPVWKRPTRKWSCGLFGKE